MECQQRVTKKGSFLKTAYTLYLLSLYNAIALIANSQQAKRFYIQTSQRQIVVRLKFV